MIKNSYIFTSESVAEGHPDKICDQISDAILDFYIAKNPNVRVAAEVVATPKKVVVCGEIGGIEFKDHEVEEIVRNTIRDIGYEQKLFHWDKIDVEVLLTHQSPNIAVGVLGENGKEEGAGDQGIMFGYASSETERLMPAPIFYAHRILEKIQHARRSKAITGLGSDAKSQISLEYEDGIPVRAHNIVVSVQHNEDLSQKDVKDMIRPIVIASLPDPSWMCKDEDFLVNPTGIFVLGGPESDSGLTGRKIIVDTYGGAAPHGGGAFSGKDPSKVDRSGAYALRYLAKNIVASGLASKCTIQISYAIGVAKPLSFYLTTHRTGALPDEEIVDKIKDFLDLRPRSIRQMLDLDRPIYRPTASYGHFGREAINGLFPWEKLDLVGQLKRLF